MVTYATVKPVVQGLVPAKWLRGKLLAEREGKRMKKASPFGKTISFVVVAVVFVGINACSLPRNPVPIERLHEARLLGFPAVRSWGDRYGPHFRTDLVESIRQEGDVFSLSHEECCTYNALALSGGGPNGAFGAGFMYGWKKAGTRPEFKIVTGISAGALMAPFVFAGPEFEQRLGLFTTMGTMDLLGLTGPISPLWSESLAEAVPLARLLKQYIDDELLAAIANAHNHGRRLYIGTTNIDAEELVVWNMGAIATSGHPEAPKIFRRVMRASAAIPGAFPPVYFDVEVDGKMYDELHIDGGVTREVFLYGFISELDAAAQELDRKRPANKHSVYVIINSKLAASPKQVTPDLVGLIPRAVLSLVKANTLGDLYRIHAVAQRDNVDFNYAFIPDDYVPKEKEPFDPKEMKRLFDLGFNMAASGYEWHKIPPGLENGRVGQ